MLALRRIRRPIGPRVKKRTPTRPGRVTGPSRPGRVRTPSPGRVGGKKRRVIDKSPAARQAFLQSLTKEEIAQRFHRDPRRTLLKKLTAKPQRVQQSSRMERVARGRVEAPSKTRRVQQSSAASTAQPRVRKRRKGPSYTVTSLNV